MVEVQTRDGRAIARGFWDVASPIAVRVLESGGPGYHFAETNTLIAGRLEAALDRRLAVLDLTRTNSFRWVHGEADLLPGIHADVYADTVVVRFDGEGARAFYQPLEERLRAAAGSPLPLRSVLDRASRSSDSEPNEREVLENGLRFVVDLAHAQKGGLFLDQRENRCMVAERARGASVLNLFGYTGGFSLHAAAAGARSTDTVDVAGAANETARRNFQLNHLSLAGANFHISDAFVFLTAAIDRGETLGHRYLRPAQLCPQQGCRTCRIQGLSTPAQDGGHGYRAGRPALRGLLFESRQSGRLPGEYPGRRGSGRSPMGA